MNADQAQANCDATTLPEQICFPFVRSGNELTLDYGLFSRRHERGPSPAAPPAPSQWRIVGRLFGWDPDPHHDLSLKVPPMRHHVGSLGVNVQPGQRFFENGAVQYAALRSYRSLKIKQA